MNESVRQKIAKVYELVKNGATEGEREAAKNRLDVLMQRYNVSENMLESIDEQRYAFKYNSNLEKWLLKQIVRVLISVDVKVFRSVAAGQLVIYVTYIDWITVDCAYEYFRRHMKKQWDVVCISELQKCRKVKTKTKRRQQLQNVFIHEYLIKSKLYKPEELTTVEVKSKSELADRRMMKSVEGGSYNKQLSKGLLLDN